MLHAVESIVATVYPQNIAIIAVHTDSKFVHGHVLLDSVNAVTGRKFSQSPSDLNRVKQKANSILKKYGFEIITAGANEFVDHTDHSKEEGFDFLELDESQFITESDMEEIATFTDSVNIINTSNTLCGWDYSSFRNYNYGGYPMNNYNPYKTQPQAIPTTVPVVDVVSSNTPTVQSTQNPSLSATSVEAVPAAAGTLDNSYPTTSVVTGPTFCIKGTSDSNFAGLSELVEQTTAYAQEHQREAANLALAMNQYAQQSGYPSNVSVCAGPIFDIDLTGSIYPPMTGNDGNKY